MPREIDNAHRRRGASILGAMLGLCAAFLDGLRGHPAPPPAGHDLESRLSALVGDDAELARAIGRRIDRDDDPDEALGRVRARDLALALACARGDQRALAALEELLARVPGWIRRTGAPAEEVAQELRERLLVAEGRPPRILDYSGKGELAAWLRIVALRAALRIRRRQEPAREPPAELLGQADPERDYLRLRYRGEYERAFREALAALEPGARLLLKLHYVDALSLERLAALRRVHRATVARHLAEHRRRLLEATRSLLRERLRLTDSEFESVLRLVRSQLAVSVRDALGSGN